MTIGAGAAGPIPGRDAEQRALLAIPRRFIVSLLLLFAAATIVFLIFRVVADDVAQLFPEASSEEIRALKARLGADKNVAAQYGEWLGDLVRLDTGNSLYGRMPVFDLIGDRIWRTVELWLAASLLALMLALPAVLFIAGHSENRRRGSLAPWLLLPLAIIWVGLAIADGAALHRGNTVAFILLSVVSVGALAVVTFVGGWERKGSLGPVLGLGFFTFAMVLLCIWRGLMPESGFPLSLLVAGTFGFMVSGALGAGSGKDTMAGILGPLFGGTFLAAMPAFVISFLAVVIVIEHLDWFPSTRVQQLTFSIFSLALAPMAVLALAGQREAARWNDVIDTVGAERLVAHLALNLVGNLLRYSGVILAMTVLLEVVFNIPGAGHLLVDSVVRRDFPVSSTVAVVYAFLAIAGKFAGDIVLAVDDLLMARVRVPSSEGSMMSASSQNVSQPDATLPRGGSRRTWIPVAIISALLLALIVFVAAFASLITDGDPRHITIQSRLVGPGQDGFLLGTDQIGRDIYSQLVHAVQKELIVQIIVTVIVVLLALGWGVLAGYVRRRQSAQGDILYDLVSFPLEALASMPFLVFAVIIMVVKGSSVANVVLVGVLVVGPRAAIVVRDLVASRPDERGHGTSLVVVGVVVAFFIMAGTFLVSVSLSFLGFGIPPSDPSLGGMLGGARNFVRVAPWAVVAPALAISFISFAWLLPSALLSRWWGFGSDAVLQPDGDLRSGPTPSLAFAPGPSQMVLSEAAQVAPSVRGPTSGTRVEYAGFWRRFVAWIVDALVLLIPNVILALVNLVVPFLGSVLGIILGWLYFAIMESSNSQATIGKMTMGIIVTDARGNKISFGQATGRYFAKILSSLILLIGYLMAGWTAKKQALHDMIADTLVVVKPQ